MKLFFFTILICAFVSIARSQNQGVIFYNNGEVYEGDLIDGKPNGTGLFIIANVDWYNVNGYYGKFSDGKFISGYTLFKVYSNSDNHLAMSYKDATKDLRYTSYGKLYDGDNTIWFEPHDANCVENWGYLDKMKSELNSIVTNPSLKYFKLYYLIRMAAANYSFCSKAQNCSYWREKISPCQTRDIIMSIVSSNFDALLNNEPMFTDIESQKKKIEVLKSLNDIRYCASYASAYIEKNEKYLVELIQQKAKEKVANAIAKAEKLNIILRHTFKYGTIGTDYIPTIERSRKKVLDSYYVNETNVEISQYENYSIGGYSKNVSGYTAVYQLINNSDNYYIVPIEITASCKFSKTIVDNSFWTGTSYKTQSEFKPIKKRETYKMGPKEAVKDQEIVGELEPDDFTINLGNVVIVSKSWIDELDLALSSNNLDIVNRYLDDVNATNWHAKILNNKQRIEANMAEEITVKYIPFTKAAIKPLNDLTYDPDFDSEVEVKIMNNSDKALKVAFTVPFGNYNAEIQAKSTYIKNFTIKGHTKNELFIKINSVSLNSL